MASPSRYACLWAKHFAATALARSEPALRGRPLAVLVGTAATRMVLEVSAEAWQAGARPGMPAAEAMTRVPGLVGHARDLEAERSAAAALLDVARATSPRVEVAAPSRLHVDLSGLAPLFGDEPAIGERLRLGAESLDVPVRVGIAGSRTAAALATRAAPGLTVVPPGTEATFLAPLPVALVDPEPELAVALERWGIRTLGELAALPAYALLVRLGAAGAELRGRARGEDDGPFVPWTAPEEWREALALDWEVAELEALVFVLHRLLERLATRLALRELGATALVLTADLADGGTHRHRLPLVAPLREPRTLAGLVRAGLQDLTLPAPVVGLAVLAETAPLAPAQPDLFLPRRPSPHELARTLGQLVTLVGTDRVGAPVLGDTHRPDAIGVGSIAGAAGRKAAVAALAGAEPTTLACRRFVPPLPAVVQLGDQSPRHVEAMGVRGMVLGCAGPWRTAGEWWTDTAWSREEWDVALPDGAVYRLALDRARGSWSIDAVYD
jgi:protein ImuB